MSNINMITVMLIFIQAINLLSLMTTSVDFSTPAAILKTFWPGILALICYILGQVTKPKN